MKTPFAHEKGISSSCCSRRSKQCIFKSDECTHFAIALLKNQEHLSGWNNYWQHRPFLISLIQFYWLLKNITWSQKEGEPMTSLEQDEHWIVWPMDGTKVDVCKSSLPWQGVGWIAFKSWLLQNCSMHKKLLYLSISVTGTFHVLFEKIMTF